MAIEEIMSPGDLPVRTVDFVVGIGASAGGLKSLEEFFPAVNEDTGFAFVVVQHMSPDFKSLMDEILSRYTSLSIRMARNGEVLRRNTLFLIPPGKNLELKGNQFVTSNFDREQIHYPIDIFLTSLAQSFGPSCAGVVLSGTGTDGSRGIRDIHFAGGLTFVEDPETAQFDGMPKNAISTKCIDLVKSPKEIASFISHHAVDPILKKDGDVELDEKKLKGISLIFSLLCERYEIDFAHYKPSTVARRIDRRQQFSRVKSIEEYAQLCKSETSELDSLYQDLLIGVTKFFRDTDAFAELAEQIEHALAVLPATETFRGWVAACATGEEAYSIGMLIFEAFEKAGRVPNFKLFATDVHQDSLDFAAQGCYSEESLEFVNNDRQARFFNREEKGLRVDAVLRRHVVFARHNLIKDPPFTRLDLATCRNLLIYFKTDAQRFAISSLHFSLKPSGILFLGAGETPTKFENEFEQLGSRWKVYRKIRNLNSMLSGNIEEGTELLTKIAKGPRRLVNMLNNDKPESLSFSRLIDAYDVVLREFIPAGVLLDENRKIIHVFGAASKYLHNSGGRFSGSILDFLPSDVRTTVAAALIRAAKEQQSRIELNSIVLNSAHEHEKENVNLTIKALPFNVASSFVWLVAIEPADAEDDIELENVIRVEKTDDTYATLESELIYTKENLSATIEELESSNEELAAANEQLIASNEELQSANQELHSVNEELYTVNSENQRRIDELEQVTADIDNLLASTDIATIFLDQNLRIRKYTKAVERYLKLVISDIGRQITDFDVRLKYVDLAALVTKSVESETTISKHVVDQKGDTVLLRILPYESGRPQAGVIVNIIDLSLFHVDQD